MRRTFCIVFCLLLAVGTRDASAQAEPVERFVPPIAGTWDPVRSIGQPPRWKPFLGLGFGAAALAEEAQVGVTGSIGVYRDFINPVVGMLGGSAQAYVGQRGELLDGGARAYVSSPALFLHAGIDYSAQLNRTDFILSAQVPTTRGGWFRRGGELRVDWVPARDHSIVVGAALPIAQPFMGRTRPRQVDVPLPRPPAAHRLPPPDARTVTGAAVAELQRSMLWVTRLHNIFWEMEPRRLQRNAPGARTRQVVAALRSELEARGTPGSGQSTYQREIALYHHNLERAFGLAIDEHVLAGNGNALGTTIAHRARQIALAEVVLPYNRTVGQYKKPDVLDGLIARARARFIAREEIAQLDEQAAWRVLQVFDAWMYSFEALRQRLAELTNDSRMHWLPLAFVLQEHEHRTQQQIDALVEFALGDEFTSGNSTLYINAPQFQTELERSINETENYHVLWVHDYRGVDPLGRPDGTGFTQTTRGYLRALLNGVRRYDQTGVLPVFILMLDEHSYALHDSRLWLDLLERPLTHRVRLRPQFADMQATVEALQDSLRAAVASSRRLTAETGAFGPQWVNDVIKVHVSVTNPSDFSFRSGRLLGLRVGADNLMRDHRKIVIRDVTEADPAIGEVILAGVGVGDVYTSDTWEDRAVVLHGPATLGAKYAARHVFETHGLRGDDLPAPLRPQPYALDYAQRVEALEAAGATARVVQAHNRTGWGDKAATFVQMLLYDLAPAGTVLYVPDSLWANYEWLAQLVSAALRGCRIFIVAPAADHAPSAGFPQMSVMSELLTRLTIVQQELSPLMAEAGGELRIGLYTRQAAMDDLPARIREVDQTFEQRPFLHELFPFSDEAWAVIRAFGDAPLGQRADLPRDAQGRPPLLHRKTQLIASEALLAALARSAEMPDVLAALLRAEVEGLAFESESGPLHAQERMQPYLELLALYASLPQDVRDTTLVYFMVGSLNKDVRSMALDGEVMALVANAWALQAVLDFFLLSGAVTWVESLDDVRALAPHYPPLKRWIGRLLHRVL
jgi:hypothetical protein